MFSNRSHDEELWSEAVKWATEQERERCVAILECAKTDNESSLYQAGQNDAIERVIEAIQRAGGKRMSGWQIPFIDTPSTSPKLDAVESAVQMMQSAYDQIASTNAELASLLGREACD